LAYRTAVGIAVATPTLAVLQGAFLLYEYRANHGDAPRPEMPARGIVIALDEEEDEGDRGSRGGSNNGKGSIRRRWSVSEGGRRQLRRLKRQWKIATEPPLRLLVIGDSLAAGVGMSKSSVPILPSSIAQALSKSNGGRPVYWTCVGTPGSSSSQIVQQVYHLEDIPQPLTDRLVEWQSLSRQRAMNRLHEFRRKAQIWWWKHREPLDMNNSGGAGNNDDNGDQQPVPRNPIRRWWRRTRLTVQRDWTNLRRVMKQENTHRRLEHGVTTMLERNALDPSFVNQYDVAVVLTGLNDLKDAFLPFMMTDRRAKMLKEAKDQNNKSSGNSDNANDQDGLKGELLRVVEALRSRMGLPTRDGNDDQHSLTKKKSSGNNILATANDEGRAAKSSPSPPSPLLRSHAMYRKQKGPLVVFPALPISPTVLGQATPLSWFLIPLIRGMDRNKKFLAEQYPEMVVFIEPPDPKVFSDAEAHRGALWEDSQGDRVLLKLNDIALHVRERVEDLMHQHYKSWVTDAEDDDEDGLYFLEADDVAPVSDWMIRNRRSHPGKSMISVDGIHPNDSGYEFWGRFIGRAIMDHWDEQHSETTWKVSS